MQCFWKEGFSEQQCHLDNSLEGAKCNFLGCFFKYDPKKLKKACRFKEATSEFQETRKLSRMHWFFELGWLFWCHTSCGPPRSKSRNFPSLWYFPSLQVLVGGYVDDIVCAGPEESTEKEPLLIPSRNLAGTLVGIICVMCSVFPKGVKCTNCTKTSFMSTSRPMIRLLWLSLRWHQLGMRNQGSWLGRRVLSHFFSSAKHQ